MFKLWFEGLQLEYDCKYLQTNLDFVVDIIIQNKY